MASGAVRFFNSAKGWGFVTSDSGPDVFVHIRDIRKSGLDELREGQRVTFETAPGRDGKAMKAVNIAMVR